MPSFTPVGKAAVIGVGFTVTINSEVAVSVAVFEVILTIWEVPDTIPTFKEYIKESLFTPVETETPFTVKSKFEFCDEIATTRIVVPASAKKVFSWG